MTIESIVLLFVILTSALVSDIKERRVSNQLIGIGFLFGVALNLFLYGFNGTVDSILGMLTGLVLLIVPFAMRVIGGGDVKLLMVIGAFLGPNMTINSFLYSAVIGGLISLVILLQSNKASVVLKRLGKNLLSIVLVRSIIPVDQIELQSTIPYVVPIYIGTTFSIALKMLYDYSFIIF